MKPTATGSCWPPVKPYLKMSYSTFGYGGSYGSSGAQVGLSSSPISHYTLRAAPQSLSLLCPLSTLESPLGRLLRLGPATVCKPAVFGRNGPTGGIRRDAGACGDLLCVLYYSPQAVQSCGYLLV